MRALMITPDERHLDRRIAQEAASLAAHGWSVDIFPAVDPSLTYGGTLPDSVRLLASPHSQRLPNRRRRVLRALRRRLAPTIPLVDRAIEAARYRRSDRAGAISAANAAHLLRLGPYDLLFAHDVPVFPLGAELKARWTCPLVCDLHEIFPEQDEHFTTETARRYWRGVEADGLANADGIICVNPAVADYVRDRYAPRATTVVAHNSMPFVERGQLSGRTIRDVYSLPADRRVMLFAGSLRPHANLETVITGFDAAGLGDWVLAVIGDGPLRASLEHIIRRRALSSRVHLGRRVAEADLVSVAASADMAVLPYQAVGVNHTIATPNKLFEYMQARLPMAASRLPMIEAIVSGADIGGFVDFSTEASTGEGLRRFVIETMPTIRPEALEAAAARYSWEREEPALFEVVSAAMSRRPR